MKRDERDRQSDEYESDEKSTNGIPHLCMAPASAPEHAQRPRLAPERGVEAPSPQAFARAVPAPYRIPQGRSAKYLSFPLDDNPLHFFLNLSVKLDGDLPIFESTSFPLSSLKPDWL